MSLRYKPDNAASPDSFWGPLFLANRDITGQAPLDKVCLPGIYITTACFADGVYDDIPFQTCLSNLLASQYRRIVLDLYWDIKNRRFSVCPVELPISSGNATSTAGHAASVMQTSPSSTPSVNATLNSNASRSARQISSNSTTIATLSPTASAPYSTTTGVNNNVLIKNGPYQCSQDLTLQSVISIYDDYIQQTTDAVTARFQTLAFNLHVAAPLENPTGQPRTPTVQQLPDTNNLIGSQVYGSVGRSLYTPPMLQSERSDLNASWFSVRSVDRLPITEYFNIFKSSNNEIATEDGWPNEQYLIFQGYRRLLLEWGSIDAQMSAYNFPGDADMIFPRGYLAVDRAISSNNAGNIESGCYYSNSTTAVNHVNNSWAMAVLNQMNIAHQLDLVDNITACGITPYVNATLDGNTADDNPATYLAVSQAALFGWAEGEPRNISAPGLQVDGSAAQWRCAIMDLSSTYRGQWRLENCQNKHRAACRIGNQPFQWKLSTIQVPYGAGPDVCASEGATFAVPRTGLENTFLCSQGFSATQSAGSPDSTSAVWINLNSLDVQNCWVTSGPNGSCIYQQDQDEQHSRDVLIPTIGALIVLILTVLTVLVKCNINRRNTRARRSGPGGWEYEGVPS